MADRKVPEVLLDSVDERNWRDVAALEVNEDQKKFVADPSYYLCLCHYGELWNPLAINFEDEVVGFMMWAVDDDDGSCWFGGIIIDKAQQGCGLGHAAVREAITLMTREYGHNNFALSYLPGNIAARHIYSTLGFRETGEMEDDEVVARLVVD